MKKYFYFYENNAKQLEVRYLVNEKDGPRVEKMFADTLYKLKSFNDVLPLIYQGNFDLFLNTKDSDFLMYGKKKPFKELSLEDLDLYLKNIVYGKENNQNLILDFESKDVEVCIEPTPRILSFFEINDLSKGIINAKIIPVKEFLNKKENDAIENETKKSNKKLSLSSAQKVILVITASTSLIAAAKALTKSISNISEYQTNISISETKETLTEGQTKDRETIEAEEKLKDKNLYEFYDNLPLENAPIIVDNQEILTQENPIFENVFDEEKNKIYQNVLANYGNIINNYATTYGVDPNLMAAIITQESLGIPSREFNELGSIGLCQIQNINLGEVKHAYNTITQQNDFYEVKLENIQNDEENIRCGTIMMAGFLEHFDGNIVMALQAYNYGENKVDEMLTMYANDTGKTKEQIISDYNDYGWLSYRDQNYGNYRYVEDVLSALEPDTILNVNVKNKNSSLSISSSYEKSNRML